MAKLVIREGQQAGREYVFPPRATSAILGRSAASDLQVLDSQSSRRHAEITIDGSRFTLRDLGSSNGTKLDGRKIGAPEEIRYGSHIQIGTTKIELVDDSLEEEGQPPEIPGHTLIEKIGSGGMGTVYKAKQLSMDRVVAVKILNKKYSTDRAFIGRFVREARAAGRLGHPNVIHVNDVGRAGDVHYFSMEFVDGTTVKAMLKEHGRLDADLALDTVLQTARALKYAHDNGIIHRDIKPDNIMVSKEGTVKISDLGIAKTFEDSSTDGSQKRIFGTPHYMSPEQALGKEIDARADVYSLGATFYHMLTGSTPFSGKTVLEVLKAHIEGHLPPVKEKAPDVLDSAVHVVERMMARQPDKRYPGMAELMEDLVRVQHDREAEIERLAEGESSIMRSAKRAASVKKKAEPAKEAEPRKLPAWAGPLMGAGAVLGLVGLFVLTVFIARTVGGVGDPAEILENARELREEGLADKARDQLQRLVDAYPDSPQAVLAREMLEELERAAPPDVQAGPEAAEGSLGDVLKSVAKLDAEGDLDGALAAIRKGMETFADDAGFCEKAKAIEAKLKEKAAEKNEQAARDALAGIRRFAEENPDDAQGFITRLRALAETFEGTEAAKEAAGGADRAARELARKQAAEARRDYEEARDAAAEARRRSDYDVATGVLRAFLKKRPDSAQAAEARLGVQELEREVKSAYDKALAQSNRSLEARRYKLARGPLERFQKSQKSQKWNSEARQRIAELEKVVADAFKEEHEEVKVLLAAFNYGDAAVQYRLLASNFGGTSWQKVVEGRLREIDAEQRLLAELIRRITVTGAASPRELPFPAPKVPENMAKLRWRVLKATEQEVTLAAGPGNRTLRGARWEDFPPEHLIDLFEEFFPEPTREEHLALAYLCRERGLEDRAQRHLAAAAGNP